ncbi:FAD-dependent oxidoreductase [Actinomadura fulvescens]|uniref:FAD-dependent oxidoreductase n=1 Tax=Actinomadura fulvescens TaxID=46160 RepID=A0ABN3Q472_9ACTN
MGKRLSSTWMDLFMRIGIVGGGITGLVTAWLLDGFHDVLLLERNRRIGGNAHSVSVRLPDGELTADLGVHSFSRGLFPTHARLLGLLGLREDDLIDVPMSLTMWHAGRPEPTLVTPHRRDTDTPDRAVLGPAWKAVGAMLEQGAQWQKDDVGWNEPYGNLVESLAVPDAMKRDVLYPWPASLFSCELDQIGHMSARAVLDFFLEPEEPPADEAVRWQNLRGGAETLAWTLAAGTHTADIRTSAGLRTLRRTGEVFELGDSAGGRHEVDHLVLALPADVARTVLAQLAGTESLRELLGAFTYVPITVGAHTDTSWMPARREQWSTDNIIVQDDMAVSTRWCGPAYGMDFFVTRLRGDRLPARGVLAQTRLRHMQHTTEAMQAKHGLSAFQGLGDVHLAGPYLQGVDSQENAVRSAVDVARRFVPDTSDTRLAALLP